MPMLSCSVHVIVIECLIIVYSFHTIEASIKLYLNESHIDGNIAHHNLESGDNLTIICVGNSPLEWRLPEVTNEQYQKFTKMSISSHNSTKGRNNQYFSNLDIVNISFPFVGFYSCFEKENKTKSKKIYLYVHDDRRLAVNERNNQYIYSVKNTRTVIPCRPTSLDINVTLMDDTRSPVELGKHGACDHSFHYNPYEGFFTVAEDEIVCELYCSYSRKKSSNEYSYVLTIEQPTSNLAEPSIITNKKHFVVGDVMILECIVRTDVHTVIKWKFPRNEHDFIKVKKLKPDGRRVKSRLMITNTTLKDGGKYRCLAQDKQNHSSQKDISIFVHDVNDTFIIFTKPEKSIYTEDIIRIIGKSVCWNITFEAYPRSDVKWFDDKENPIIMGQHTRKYEIETSESFGYLCIKNITYKDHGLYKLVVSNSKQKKTHTELLNVTGVPEMNLDVDRFQLPDEETYITCKVVSNPKSDVSIEYKSCTDNTCEYKKLHPETREDGFMILKEAKVKFNKSSTVKCTAKNDFGSKQGEREVHISGWYCLLSKRRNRITLRTLVQSPSFLLFEITGDARSSQVNRNIPGGLEIQVKYTEATIISLAYDKGPIPVGLGESLTLLCRAFIKNIDERLEWRKENRKIEANNIFPSQSHTSSTGKTLSMVINNTQYEDRGNYKCVLIEAEIVTREEEINIAVKELSTPSIESPTNGTLRTNIGNSEILNCTSFGIPRPEISWFKDGGETKPGSFKSFHRLGYSSSYLHINTIEAEDEGEYKCEAINRLGKAQMTWTLEVIDKPSSKVYYWLAIILLMILVIVTSAIVNLKDHRKKKLEKMLCFARFEQGQLENLNPELGLEDQVELLPYDRVWEFPLENLKIGKQLGAGAFGIVMKGEAKGIIPGEERTTVAVKMAKKDVGHTYTRALASELKIMVHLGNHLNVVNLLGACTKNIAKDQLFVIVEYCKFGNTHNYLYRHRNEFIDQIDLNTGIADFNIGNGCSARSYSVASTKSVSPMNYVTQFSISSENKLHDEPEKCNIVSMCPRTEEGEDDLLLSNNSSIQPDWRTNYRGDYKGSVRPICTRDLLIWAFQVARGMEYLASRKVLHGDLAARNILLADDNVVKICDFGLAKSMYKNDNYKKNSDCPLPIKWMAIESIRDRIFSTQSDVWSFGIVLWEFFSLASTPYPGMDADERLYTKLVEGYRMEAPKYATNEIEQIMLKCWSHDPLDRPSFRKLEEKFGKMIGEQLRQYYSDLNDPYMKWNVDRKESGIDDYLEKVSSPNFEYLSTPHLYTNQFNHSSGYLSMKSPGINSPRPQDNTVFSFETNPKEKCSTATCNDNIDDNVFVEKENEGESVMKNSSHEREGINEETHDSAIDFTNPSYIYPPIRDSTCSDLRQSSDKYIVMSRTSNSCIQIGEKSNEVL